MRCWRIATRPEKPQPARGLTTAVTAVLGLGLMVAPLVAVEPPIDIRFGRHPGYWRVAMEWTSPASVSIDISDEVVAIGPLALPEGIGPVQAGLRPVVRAVAYEDGVLRLHLREGVAAERLAGISSTILAIDFRFAADARPPRGPVGAWVPLRRAEGLSLRPAPVDVATTAPAAPPPGSMDPGSGAPASGEPAATTSAPARRRVPDDSLPPLPAAIVGNAAPPATASAGTPRARIVPVPPVPEPDDAPPGASRGLAAATAPPAEHGGAAMRVPIDRAQSQRVAAAVPPAPPGRPRDEGMVAAPATVPAASGGDPAEPTTAALSRAPATERNGTSAAPAPGTLQVRAEPRGTRFAVAEPTSVAAWRRGSQIWLVFAAPDLAVDVAPELAARVEVVAHPTATVLRLALEATDPVAVERAGAAWLVTPASTAVPPDGTRVPAGERAAIAIDDPWLGDVVHVVPSLEDDAALAAGRRDGPRMWLPTLQGFAYHDLSRRRAPSVLGGGGGGGERSTALAPALPRPALGAMIDLAGPTLTGEAAQARRKALELSLFADPAPARRLALVRFLLGQAAPFDALAVIAAAAETPPTTAAAKRLRALEGIAEILAGRLDAAAAKLPEATAEADPEVRLWHAMLAGARGDWSTAGGEFARSGQTWRGYPLPLRRLVARHAVQAAIELDAPQVALAVLDQVDHDDLATRAAAQLALLAAEAELRAGRADRGQRRLARLAAPPTDPDVRREAELRLTLLRLEAGELDRAGALAVLEAARIGWIGRPDADRYWSEVARLRAATGDAPGAFAAWGHRDGDRRALTPAQAELLEAAATGAPPFADALADAVAVAEAHAGRLEPSAARVGLLRGLAGRVAAETEALHVADAFYRRILAEPLPHAVDLDVRLELAELRLRRHLPKGALDVLKPLNEAADARIAPLRARASALLAGPMPAGDGAAAAAGATSTGVDAALDAADAFLAETRTLLDEDG